ncbi:MAG: T9SS type A sorting domain-containing protein [Bacteroidetes bacterium]|nr:T9SS type A sorting domain-containing protein [Bacteroidota bacterium]
MKTFLKQDSIFGNFLSVILFTAFLTVSLLAYPGGESGYTKKGSTPGCTCHTSSPSSSVTLTISGPATLNKGETGSYSVLMTYTSNITGGGMDIAASNGTLAKVDTRLKVLNGELTQPSKQTGTTQLVWSFKYTAPATAGTQTLYATGCAVKSKWNHAPNFTVTVTDPVPASLSLLTPLQGANLLSGSTTDITWSSVNVANVKLEYSTDSGTTWITIISSTPASAGSYSWTVPEVSSETCVVKVSDASNASLSSISGLFSITVPIPEYNIAHLHQNDANGVSLDTGKVVTIKGIVTVGNEFNSPSFLQDSTGGLAVFGRGVGGFSSSIVKGDYIKVTGKVVSYNGLTEINPVSEFQKLDSGLTVEPAEITISDILNQNWGGDETYEGKLIKITGLSLVSQVTTWAGNTNYIITDGTDSIQIRITTGTTLAGQPAPVDAIFTLTSVLSQYKTTAPFNSGYQLMPRGVDDIVITTGVKESETAITDYRLEQNYPNPFNPSTTISFLLPRESNVKLQVFNALGEELESLLDGSYSTGRHSVRFDASNLVSGIYFYKLTAVPVDGSKGFTELKKLVLLK